MSPPSAVYNYLLEKDPALADKIGSMLLWDGAEYLMKLWDIEGQICETDQITLGEAVLLAKARSIYDPDGARIGTFSDKATGGEPVTEPVQIFEDTGAGDGGGE